MLMATFIMTGYRRSGCFAEKIPLLRHKEGIKEGAKSKNSRGVIKKKRIEGVKLFMEPSLHVTLLYFYHAVLLPHLSGDKTNSTSIPYYLYDNQLIRLIKVHFWLPSMHLLDQIVKISANFSFHLLA